MTAKSVHVAGCCGPICLAARLRPAAVLAALVLLAGTGPLPAGSDDPDGDLPAGPRGLPPLKHPADNPPTAAKILLGKQLYFDPRLSRDGTISCASCHDPKKGYSNGEQFAKGVGGKLGDRNSPTVINAAYNRFQFWDGRAGSLEEQALGPIQNPIEMNLTLEEVEERLNEIDGYRVQFQEVFGSEATADSVARAIAAYERTILSGDAPYDRFRAGDTSALSDAAQRGLKLFFGKAQCSACHSGPNFTDNAFHNLGLGMAGEQPDVGREKISKLAGDRGSFKTPTLREIARTAPYGHDGSIATLEEVIEHYDRGGEKNSYLDESVYPLKLTPDEKRDLVTFLKEGLSSDSYPEHEPPELPK
ncbi:MAG TPA: cytochrome c peroxidase [Planctomycetaceae bacterium]|nr:cytochrome c peroxidase [Planctomycetaceae bacterium]